MLSLSKTPNSVANPFLLCKITNSHSLKQLDWIFNETEKGKKKQFQGFKMNNELFYMFCVATTLCLFCVNGGPAVSAQLNDDVLGLIVFKTHVKDPNLLLTSWNEDDDTPCSWSYVKCNPVSGRVSELSLDGLNLSGKIGRGLEGLQHLKVLSLSNNNFSDSISPEIGLIESLENLNLSHNSLTGLVPDSIGRSTSIKFLDLSRNSLTGSIPDDFFQECPSLRYLSLAKNSLGGPTPSSLSRCYSLNTLNLSNNRFSGFNSGFWSLTRLRTLDLSHNLFSGNVPEGIQALENLKQLLLQGNQFSGPLPEDIGWCPHLNTLDVGFNYLNGEIPDSFEQLSSLIFFSVSNNLITGNFPQWIGNLTSIEVLDFSNNGLTSSLPSSMGNLRALKYLSLSNNELTGEIPLSLIYCTQLSVLRFNGNSFSGSIPEGLFDLGLEEIDFSSNGFEGSIPRGSSRLFELIHTLDLSDNNLSGQIPSEFGLFASLRYLNLSCNKFDTMIPQELGSLRNLTVLDIQNNLLNGSVPGDICRSGSLEILQLDDNLLSGPIPEEIGDCTSLYLLSLSRNNLSGAIPRSISRLSNLKILKLDFNELSGEIPPQLGMLKNLLAVNISFNKLQGRLPLGSIFQSLDQTALQGNAGICSPILRGPCKLDTPKPLVINPDAYNNQENDHNPRNQSSTVNISNHHMYLGVSVIVSISAAILIAFGVLTISLLNVSARKKFAFVEKGLESTCSSFSGSQGMAAGKLVLFDTRLSSAEWISDPEYLLNKAAEIGEGVFGTVYKVSLGARARIVAIKKLVTENIIQNPDDFDKEIRILGKAKHPNLVLIKGYYWTPQLQLLVSEFVPNGSLQAKLHERTPSSPPLSWASRFNIILGISKGLAHLHHAFHPPIIHYNIKPSNILLDEKNNPKISDFGLARLLTKHERQAMSNRLGYVAPELECHSLRVNEKYDIYGFGILILELVTGKRPVEYGEDRVLILSDHVKVLLEQGNVLDCVDRTIGDYSEDEVLPVLKLALVCTSQRPSNRPSMADVVHILQLIKTPVPQRMELF